MIPPNPSVVPASERIHASLRQSIMACEIAPGATLHAGQIAEAHGGRVNLANRIEGGLSVTLALPTPPPADT